MFFFYNLLIWYKIFSMSHFARWFFSKSYQNASNQLTSDGGCTNDSFFCSGDFSILTVQLLLRWWHFGLVQHLWFSQYSLLVQVFRFFSTLSIFHRVVAATFSLLNLRVCCCFIFVLIFQKIFLNLQLIYSKCTLWFLPDIS